MVQLRTVLVVLSLALTAQADDCLNIWENDKCTVKRGTAAPSSSQSQYCTTDQDDCQKASSADESAKINCNASTAAVFAGTTCEGAPKFNGPVGNCTVLFTEGPLTFYGTLGCGVEPDETSDVTSTFLSALIFNMVLAVALLLCFCCARGRYPIYYQPRCIDDPSITPPEEGWDGWIRTTLAVSDAEIARTNGVDAAMYLMFFRLASYVFAVAMVYGMLVLMPVYDSGTEDSVEGIEEFAISHVKAGDDRLLAATFGMYVVSLAAFYFLNKSYDVFVTLRRRHLSTAHAHSFAVMVRDIPPECNTHEKLASFYKKMYPGVVGATMMVKTDTLVEAQGEREKMALKLERAECKDAKTGETSETKVGGILCFGGEKKPARRYFFDELSNQNAEFQTLRHDALKQPEMLSAGFVVFSNLRSATIAAQVIPTADPMIYETTQAPEARDVVWSNLPMSQTMRNYRTKIISICVAALVVFWLIPITFVAGLTTAENLKAYVGLDINALGSVLKGIIQGILPTLALVIFMAILPMIMKAWSTLEGLPTHSEISRGTLAKLFYFQIFNVFLASLLAASFLSVAEEIIDDPPSIFDLLGQSIPRTGTFFTNYVMLQAFVGFAMMLTRLPFIVVGKILGMILTKTPREIEKARREQRYDLAAPASLAILVFVVGLAYCTITPIITPFAFIFFGLGYLALRYSHYYIYTPAFDSGGLLWPLIFDRLMTGVFLAQFIVVAVLGVKEGTVAAPLMFPLLVITWMYWGRTNKALASVGQYLPLDAACESTIQGEGKDTVNEFVHPTLKEPNKFTPDNLYDPDFGVTDLSFEQGLDEDVMYLYEGTSVNGGEMSPERLGDSKGGMTDQEGGTLYLRLEDEAEDSQFGNTAEV
eukprot:m.178189 g.178189  ORF g.178189 m.178189 type:complete len:877 (+) comp16830_c0_seq1:105-2735(+)